MSLLDRVLLPGTVTETELLTPRMRRVRIAGEALRSLDWIPGQHVRLRVGDLRSPQTWLSGFQDVLRTYVWNHLVRELGWPRTAIRVKPFWAPGKRGMD
ncbi:hypothetical protein ABGB12_00545 [Actinocorallia sp. B10E7]|uniref:hypothetical protein n=1 Tax=Actinocorallia sp. B10E7 TaxID=3153558 RepID=UPI00325D3BCC